MVKRKQTVLESAARDRNWLLGRLRAAEKQFNSAIWAALEYADRGYVETCRRNGMKADHSKVYAFQRAATSMVQNASIGVRDHFESVRRVELLRGQIVEPTQDFSANAKDNQ